jgi:hypothetical protein
VPPSQIRARALAKSRFVTHLSDDPRSGKGSLREAVAGRGLARRLPEAMPRYATRGTTRPRLPKPPSCGDVVQSTVGERGVSGSCSLHTAAATGAL